MDSEEKLIYLVQQYKCLYDVSSTKYSDKVSKQNAWDKISQEMGISAKECAETWRRLRDNFRKAIKSREERERSGSGASKRRCIKFEKQLQFLKPYMQLRDQISNLSFPENNEQSESTQSSELTRHSIENVDLPDAQQEELPSASPPTSNINEPQPILSRSRNASLSRDIPTTHTVSHVLHEYLQCKAKEEKDPIDSFFLAMTNTVKRLPRRLQLEVRQKVFNVVNDAELKWLNESTDDYFSGYCTESYVSSYNYQPASYIPSSTPTASTSTYANSQTSDQPATYVPSSVPIATTTGLANSQTSDQPPSSVPITTTTGLANSQTSDQPTTYVPSSVPIATTTVLANSPIPNTSTNTFANSP